MAQVTDNTVFNELLEAMSPREPMVTFNLQAPLSTRKAHDCLVVVTLQDSLTVETIGEYTIDPITALNILHRAGRFAIDGDLCDDLCDFLPELYALCNAWFEHRCAPPVVIPVQSVLTVSYGEMVKMMAEAVDLNGGECGVELDGMRFKVQHPAS